MRPIGATQTALPPVARNFLAYFASHRNRRTVQRGESQAPAPRMTIAFPKREIRPPDLEHPRSVVILPTASDSSRPRNGRLSCAAEWLVAGELLPKIDTRRSYLHEQG
jgi:hypothetical protein